MFKSDKQKFQRDFETYSNNIWSKNILKIVKTMPSDFNIQSATIDMIMLNLYKQFYQ